MKIITVFLFLFNTSFVALTDDKSHKNPTKKDWNMAWVSSL